MLEIRSDNIYITKGDTGKIDITLSGNYAYSNGDELIFYVRNARNLDNIQFMLQQGGTNNSTENGQIIHSATNTKSWEIDISAAATENMKRGTYVYDIKLIRSDGTINTFVGGDVSKLSFVVT